MGRKKKAVKIKEVDNRQFKEVKKEKNGKAEIEDESELEQDIFGNGAGNGFSSAQRTAPTLNQENSSQLESAAASAPARTAGDSGSGGGNLYSADYVSRYDSQNYDNVRDEQPVVRPSIRAAGSLTGVGQFDMRSLRRMQSAWQSPQDPGQPALVDSNLPEEKRYQPREDSMKEDVKRIERRRRMF